MRSMRRLTTGLYLFAAACSNGTVSTIDASAPDANQSADVQASDAEASDAAGADASRADAGAIDSGAGCAAPTGGPTRHNGVTLNATESWRAADSPHVVLGDYVVGVGGRLILEPCTEIQIVSGSYFYVLGALSARGEPGRPITIRARDVGTRFASIVIRTATVADLAWVEIEDGGDLPNSTAGTTLLLQSPGWPPSPVAHVEHVVIRDSAGYGVDVQGHARFTPTSQDLTIVGAGARVAERPYPMRIVTNSIGSIPTGQYTGNARDEIQIVGQAPHSAVEVDDAIHDRGVPYHVGGNGASGLIVVNGGPGALATLTIDPGVELRFESTSANIGGFFVGGALADTAPRGRLIAVGTNAAPIVLTSTRAVPAPGDWEGLTFIGPVDPSTRVDHVRIEHAGAHGGDSGWGCPPSGMFDSDGAIKIFNEPSSAFVTSSTLAHSSSHGIYRAWQGGNLSLLATNTFIDIAGCFEVEPKAPPPGPVCSPTPSCPR